jgi:hypothetical protein
MTGETSLLSRHFSSYEPVEQILLGPAESVLTSSDTIFGFKRKPNLCKNRVVRENPEMFPLLLGLESEEGYQQVSSLTENHHEELRNKIKPYFPSIQHK